MVEQVKRRFRGGKFGGRTEIRLSDTKRQQSENHNWKVRKYLNKALESIMNGFDLQESIGAAKIDVT